MMRSGVPDTVFSEMRSLYEEVSLLTDSLEESDFKPLLDDMEIEFDGGRCRNWRLTRPA